MRDWNLEISILELKPCSINIQAEQCYIMHVYNGAVFDAFR